MCSHRGDAAVIAANPVPSSMMLRVKWLPLTDAWVVWCAAVAGRSTSSEVVAESVGEVGSASGDDGGCQRSRGPANVGDQGQFPALGQVNGHLPSIVPLAEGADHQLVELRQPALVLGHDPRFEGTLPLPPTLDGPLPDLD